MKMFLFFLSYDIIECMKKITETKLKASLKNSSSPVALSAQGQMDVYLAPIGKRQQSALSVYLDKMHCSDPDFSKPFPDEVMDFIVDSLDFKTTDSFLKKRLRSGLKELNKKSKTARGLIAQIPFGLKVSSISEQSDTAGAFVLFGVDEVFFNLPHFKNKKNRLLAIEFLHETGHVLDNYQLRPFEGITKGYVDKEGKPIRAVPHPNIETESSCQLDLAFEAEKQAVSYQIESEMMSVPEMIEPVVLSVLEGACMAIGLFAKPQEANREKVVFNYSLQRAGSYLKTAVKNPKKLFSKTGREEISSLARKENMASFVKFLKKPARHKIGFRHIGSLLSVIGGVACFSLLMPGVIGTIGLLGACLGGCAYSNLKKTVHDFQYNWKSSYYEKALWRNRFFLNENKQADQASLLVLKALENKYDNFLTSSDVLTPPDKDFVYNEMMLPKRQYQKLSENQKEDMMTFVEILKAGDREGDLKDFSDEEIIFQLMKSIVTVSKQKKISPSKAFSQYLNMLIREDEVLEAGVQKLPLPVLNQIHDKELRKEILLLKNEITQKEKDLMYLKQQKMADKRGLK